jgi:hypothetical protein
MYRCKFQVPYMKQPQLLELSSYRNDHKVFDLLGYNAV